MVLEETAEPDASAFINGPTNLRITCPPQHHKWHAQTLPPSYANVDTQRLFISRLVSQSTHGHTGATPRGQEFMSFASKNSAAFAACLACTLPTVCRSAS